MRTASVLATLVVVLAAISMTEARRVRLKHTTAAIGVGSTTVTSTPSPSPAPSTHITSTSTKSSVDAATEVEVKQDSAVKQSDCPYHPAAVLKPRLVEQYDRRSADGLYEFRYVLSNGDTRYERSYWQPVGPKKKVLARRGFYSYPLPNRNFMTVVYTADQNGYHQESAKYTKSQPALPRSLLVPEDAGKAMEEPGKGSQGKKPHLKSNEIDSSEESDEYNESAVRTNAKDGGDEGQTAHKGDNQHQGHHQHQAHHQQQHHGQHQQEVTETLQVADIKGEQ